MHERNNNVHGSGRRRAYHGDGNSKENQRCADMQLQHRDRNQYHRRPRFHSTRLINESVARRTTQLFLETYNNCRLTTFGDDNYCESPYFATSPPPWRDSIRLLAAEHSLEFWANRNKNDNNYNNKNHNISNHHRSNQSSIQLEEDAAMAHRLFAALEHIHSCLDDSTTPILSNGMLSHVIDALAKSPRMEHVQLADTYLRTFIELYLVHNVQESVICQSSTDELLEQIRETPHHPQFTRNIRWNNADKHHFPNQIRITAVMRGYARQSNPKAAEALLYVMRNLSSCPTFKQNMFMQIFRPNAVGYATVIDAYSRVQDGVNAERILRLMGVTKNVVAYNATISAWARCAKVPHGYAITTQSSKSVSSESVISSSQRAAENAERLLREMWNGRIGENNDNDNSSGVLPDVVTYSTTISAYATCLYQPFGLKRAHELLTELEGLATREFEETQSRPRFDEEQNSSTTIMGRNSHGFQPNTSVYNTILQAYANVGDATSAEAILESMISLHSSSLKNGGGGPFQNVCPNTRTFNVVLNAVAKGDPNHAGLRAKKILDRLEKMMESRGNDGLRPDIISYNSVLAAWSKSASVNVNTLTKDWDDSDNCIVGKYAAHEALNLLDAIEERHRLSPDSIKPDAISYNTTISAFANAAQHCENGISMAEKAEGILTRMVELGIQPDAYSYNGVLLAWSRSSGGLTAARHAESILRSMKVSPTIVTWSTVVNAYAHADGAQRAEALLREMEVVVFGASSPRQNNKGARALPILPSIVLYNNVLHSWGRSSNIHASRNAEVLFNRMHDLPHLPSPDAISYRLVLTALEHTFDSDKAERARSILNRLLASSESNTLIVKPQEILNAYNSVLTACAYTPSDAGEQHRSNAARILVETFRDVNNCTNGGPNQETYAHFIQGCIHLFDPSSEERNALLELAFRECCNRGLLSRTIWDKFCTSIGPQAVQELLGEGTTQQFDDFPIEWCNKGP